jgi:serine/threonine-protein phosphatase PGAM5
LVRHGQYDESHKEEDDHKRVLTSLGRHQAHLTGKRLAEMIRGHGTLFKPCPVTTIVSSNMARAKETAAIIARHLPRDVARAEPDPLLNEGIPAQIIPTRPELDIQQDLNKNRKRIETAFQKYIFRHTENKRHMEDDNQDISDRHEFQIIVCHGNVIRYFFCRALQLPPEAWLRMSTYNCSLTYLMIKPNGRVSARMMGDVGHLPYSKTSFSMNHGFVP